jgi:hypothetical protein
MPAEQQLAKDDPRMVAWDAYKASDDYANSRRWALRIAPMIQGGDPDGDRKRECELMPYTQREQHVDGSLWAAFIVGWEAGRDALK